MSEPRFSEGSAIVYCEGAFNTTNGKTAHGLVRRCARYKILSVIDSRHAGGDAGEILDGRATGIPMVASLDEAVALATHSAETPTHFVIGLAPDGGRLPAHARVEVLKALSMNLNVDSGLHDFLSEDPEITTAAVNHKVLVRDIRKTPPRGQMHFFSGKINEVSSLKVAVLGTDSAVGKRTSAWLLVDALEAAGISAEMVGTGQTAWMQGARHSIILDSLINDFVAGEIEHAVWSAWQERHPKVIVIEGQGSLMNPAYPGGFEILAAGRPDMVLLQHAPKRMEYDGFPGHSMHSLPLQIQAIELISSRPVVAITVNHEDLTPSEIPGVCRQITSTTGLPAFDVLTDGAGGLVELVKHRLESGVGTN